MTEQTEVAYKGPFWRSNGAIFIVLKSLAEAERVLNKMLREQRIVDSKLAGFYAPWGQKPRTAGSDFAWASSSLEREYCPHGLCKVSS